MLGLFICLCNDGLLGIDVVPIFLGCFLCMGLLGTPFYDLGLLCMGLARVDYYDFIMSWVGWLLILYHRYASLGTRQGRDLS